MTPEAFLTLALACQPPTPHPDTLALVLRGIAIGENESLEPTAINHNANGTDDRGLMQINTSHLGEPIGYHGHTLTLQSLSDPCENIAAGGWIFLAGLNRYNGRNPDHGLANSYTNRAIATVAKSMKIMPARYTPAPTGSLQSQMLTTR